MKTYKTKFVEEEIIKLDNVELVDKIFAWFKENPYPQDHSGVHKFAESLGLDADIIETYIYAIVSCFVSGGNFNKSGKKLEDFDPEELKMGKEKVEIEHIDKNNKNPVVKRISEIFAERISADHLSDNSLYYSQARDGKLQIEELTK